MTDLRTGIEVDKLSQIFDEIKRGILPKPMFINVINAAILKLIDDIKKENEELIKVRGILRKEVKRLVDERQNLFTAQEAYEKTNGVLTQGYLTMTEQEIVDRLRTVFKQDKENMQ